MNLLHYTPSSFYISSLLQYCTIRVTARQAKNESITIGLVLNVYAIKQDKFGDAEGK